MPHYAKASRDTLLPKTDTKMYIGKKLWLATRSSA